jgi:hypothetical protein
MSNTPNNNNFNNNEDFDADTFRDDLESQFDSDSAPVSNFETNLNHLRKYTKIDLDARENMISRSSQESIYADTVEKLTPEQRLQKAMDIYIETINRNLPEIDQNLVRNLVNDTVEGMLPLVFKASEEIKHRYEDTGKFEGYEHPEIKAIIEKHLMSAHNSSKGSFKKIMEKLGTPMHEVFGKGNHIMGEQGKVFNNVHTAVTRGGTIFAAGLAVKELSTLFPVYGALPLAGILFTMTQSINEVTNEAEHSTLEKRNPFNKLTKWTTIAAAKSAPIALLALTSMGGISPNLEQNYLEKEGTKLATKVIELSHGQTKDGKIPRLEAKLRDLNAEIETKTKIKLSTKDEKIRQSLLREIEGLSNRKEDEKLSLNYKKQVLEKEISDALKANESLIAEYHDKGPVNFIVKHAELKYGDNAGAAARYRETINDYSKLDAGARISNGMDYMGRKVYEKEFADELFTMIYIAMLVESLSVITLLLVQSRADFRKVITNSDSQKALASIIEGAILLNKQVGAETDFNEFRSDEDKLLTHHKDKQSGIENKFTKLSVQSNNQDSEFKPKNVNAQKIMQFRSDISEIAKALFTGGKEKEAVRVEPPSYSSLVKSLAVQQAIQEMYRDGHVPSMNQVIHDISRDLIKPIPVIPETKKKLTSEQEEEDASNAQKRKSTNRNEQQENNPIYAATIPKRITMSIEKDVIGGKGKAMDVMKHNLENILETFMPLNEKVMREELAKKGAGKIEKFDDMIRLFKNAINDLGNAIETDGATDDRLDIKNKIIENIKNAIEQFESNKENHTVTENIKETPNQIQKKPQETESNTSKNYTRMNNGVNYIARQIQLNYITPSQLSDIIKCFIADGYIYEYKKGWNSKRNKEQEDLVSISRLKLSSPFEASIEKCIADMGQLAILESAKYKGQGKYDLQSFKNKLSKILNSYSKESKIEQAFKANRANVNNSTNSPHSDKQKPQNPKSSLENQLDEEDLWA